MNTMDGADAVFEKLVSGIRRNGEWLERMDQVRRQTIFTSMVDVVPEGKCGDACIEHFEVQEGGSAFRKIIAELSTENRWWEYVPPGRYARLLINSKLFMTDTLFEKFAAMPLIDNARGDVLVTGLGLGMLVPPLVAKRAVTSLTIIEKNADVIKLVEPHVRCGTLLRVIHDDAYLWEGGDRHYDTIFHDIWPTVNPANLMLFPRIEERYAKWLRPDGWQDCWSKELCELKARDTIAEVTDVMGGDPLKWPSGLRQQLRGWAL